MLKKLFSKPTKQEVFWNWFTKNNETYFHFEQNRNALFIQLHSELNKIDKNLVFEFSPVLPDGTREFVISADGIKSSFSAVIELVNSAPSLNKWKIIAFRQPKKGIDEIKYQNLTIKYENVFFRFGKDSGQIALELNIRHFSESTEWSAGVFILLDNVLGEYNTEMYLSRIEKKLLDEAGLNSLFPIAELPKVLDDYLSELNN